MRYSLVTDGWMDSGDLVIGSRKEDLIYILIYTNNSNNEMTDAVPRNSSLNSNSLYAESHAALSNKSPIDDGRRRPRYTRQDRRPAFW